MHDLFEQVFSAVFSILSYEFYLYNIELSFGMIILTIGLLRLFVTLYQYWLGYEGDD